ncbi:hypothetical protein BCR42DRAFT_417310 [Absidia repens]|uniref:Uncharacterized protein n=1 Tax=Absidia repens TaxID=90262 RepID=A0A1X2IE25_9FUNG|nr:hypothetical protein BCR42DRAFT_417310 [Absidia repens]
MHSNHHTLRQHHNITPTTTQRQQGYLNGNTRSTYIPPSLHLPTPSQADPFANMSAYVDYQKKIETLKTSLATNVTKSTAASATVTSRDDYPSQMIRPLTSTERHHHRQESFTIDLKEDEDGRFWSNGSIMSSGSSNSSGSSSGFLTPPRSLSPMTTTTTTTTAFNNRHHRHHHQEQLSSDSDTCYVTMEDRLKFLSFLRHRTGWHTDTVTDLDYMKNSGSLFFWDGQ